MDFAVTPSTRAAHNAQNMNVTHIASLLLVIRSSRINAQARFKYKGKAVKKKGAETACWCLSHNSLCAEAEAGGFCLMQIPGTQPAFGFNP
jgi:hypothetical protein